MIKDSVTTDYLPLGWAAGSLGDILYLKNGFAFKSSDYANHGVPVVRISNIQSGIIILDDAEKIEEKEEYENFVIEKGDILIAMSGATTGKFGIFLKSDKAYQNQRVGNFKPFSDKLVNKKFIYFLLERLKKKIEDRAYGGAQPNISAEKIESIQINLPPLAEQHRIIAKIEELFSDLDAGIASLKQAQAQLKTYRQAVLKYAFEGKLTAAWREQNTNLQNAFDYLASIQRVREREYKSELDQAKRDKTKPPIKDYDFEFHRDKEIPSWAEATLDKLIYIAGRIGWRGLKKEEYTNDGPLFLSVHSLNYGKIVGFSEAYHVTDWRYEESSEIKLQENDILLCKDGAGIGKIGIVKNLKERATVNSSLLVIRSKEIFLPDFLYYFLNGPELQTVVQSRITGSATPHLFQKDIRMFNLRVPPLEEQHQIVQEIESRLSVCDKLEESIKESLQKAEALRQSILKKAFEGKLVPQDPNDEPAEKLLERIRAEKNRNQSP